MRRREFVTLLGGAVAAWPVAARSQQPSPIVGFLSARSRDESAHLIDAFRHGLAEHGAIEGSTATIVFRFADGHYDQLATQAADLVNQQVAVLAAVGGDMSARAAAAATRTIPIVAVFIGDPVASGQVASLNRPGGNVTGVSNLNAVIKSKRLGLLRELLVSAETIGALQNPSSPTASSQQLNIEEAARVVGQKVLFWQASTDSQLEAAFVSMSQSRISGLLIGADAFFASARGKLVALAAQHSIPAIYSLRDVPVAGGLMSYGIDLLDTYRMLGSYAGRILKGSKPADLPVIQSTKFLLILNLKTAKALKLTIPTGILAIADEVIE